MKHTTWITIAAAVFTTVSAPALTAERGFYVAASAGQPEEDPDSIGVNFSFNGMGIQHLDPIRVTVDDSAAAWSAAAGYRINRYLAAEVEYLSFGTTDIAEYYDPGMLIPPGLFPLEYSSKISGPALSLLGSMPVGKRFEVFVRAGVLFADREVSIRQPGGFNETFGDTVWLGGVGVGWSFADRWALRAEYQRTGKLDETIVVGSTELQKVALGVRLEL